MLTIRLYQGSKSMENYLNKKSNKGYSLETLHTFGLFEPLRLDAYHFQKNQIKNRIYRVDSRKLNNEDLHEYMQIFTDDGWKYFSENYANDNFNVDHIFYSDDPMKHDIFSDEDSEKRRNRENAVMSLYKGFTLFMIFFFFSIFFPSLSSGNSNTILGFLLHNLYIIVAITIMLTSILRYLKNR